MRSRVFSPVPENCPSCRGRTPSARRVASLEARTAVRPACSLALSVFIAFFPKCPLCWAAYLGALGIINVTFLSYAGWLFPVLVALLGVQLLSLLRNAPRAGYGPFALSLGGAVVFLTGRHYIPATHGILIGGILLVAAGSLWNAVALREAPPRVGEPCANHLS